MGLSNSCLYPKQKNLLERQGLEIKFDLPTELKKLIDLKIKEGHLMKS